jgi:hypothetical protein
MNYVIAPTSKDITHHGILGQKWGKRQGPPYPLDGSDHSAAEKKAGWSKSLNKGHGARSIKATANRALAKVYGLNERVYQKSNPTLASMNAAAKKDALKRADEAQKAANKKKVDKLTAYRDKLSNRAQKGENRAKAVAAEEQYAIDDLKKNGINSKTFNSMFYEKHKDNEDFFDMAYDRLSKTRQLENIENFTSQRVEKLDNAKLKGKSWASANKKIMNMSISEFTSKRDIRKQYRSGKNEPYRQAYREANKETDKKIYGTAGYKKLKY